jgi:MFS family permease
VYLETGSGIATAAVYIVDLIIGVALGAYGGSLADRWPLRRTLVGTNLVQAAALLPLLAVTSGRIWPIYVVAAIQGVVRQVNDPASFAMLPRLVPSDQLVAANAVSSSGWSIARLVGSPLGGIAVAAGGINTVLVADAATFLLAGAAVAMVSGAANRAAGSSDDAHEDELVDTSVRAGIRQVRTMPAVAALIAVQTLARVAFSAFPVLFIAFVADYLDGGGREMGLIRGSSAFGGIIAGLIIARVARRYHPAAVMVVGYASFGVIGLGFVNAPSLTTTFWVYLLLFGLTGFPNVTASTGMASTAQVLCPPRLLGRLSGLSSAAGAVGAGIGSVGAGLLLGAFSARTLFNAQVACIAGCAVIGYLFVWRPVREAAAMAPTIADAP